MTNLSEAQKEVLRGHRTEFGEIETTYMRIPLATLKEQYHMTSAQKHMYLLWKNEPSLTHYNMPALFKFDHYVDTAKLTNAINNLTKRHEILRTIFTEKEGQLVQIIQDASELEIDIHEMFQTEIDTWYKKIVQPFDLEKGPLFRLEIARTTRCDYLFIDMHHIIGDGMSNALFLDELNSLFEGVELPPLERQYKDFSEWAQTLDVSQSENYWLDKLANYPLIELATDFPRPIEQQFDGNTFKLPLDIATTNKIREVVRETNTTEYIFFIAAIGVLLAKLTNEEDFVIGTPISGRIHRDTEKMLGMFVNPLIMRLKPENDKTFADYLLEVKEQTLAADEHQIYPLEDLIDKPVTIRTPSRNPFFDILMVYQNTTTAPLMDASYIENSPPAKFDLTFTFHDDGTHINLDLTYATSLFGESTIKIYAQRLVLLLVKVLSDPSQPIKNLNLMLDEERLKILNKFNHTTNINDDLSLARQFEKQARLHPNRITVADPFTQLTYKELDEQANEVALKLIASGLDKEAFVAVVANRNVQTILGFLSVLKAGGAYVPIDADYPETRIRFMLEDCGAKFILGNHDDLPLDESTKKKFTFIRLLNISGSTINFPVDNTGKNLAYLLYTSGTTGNPKGVMIEQQSITRLVKNTAYVDFSNPRILQTGSLSFDASTFEIWGALLNGGFVFISEMNTLVDTAKLKALIFEQKINTMWLTASLFNHLITTDVTTFDDLTELLTDGEALSFSHVNKLLNHNPNITLINSYGPTETTTFATTLAMNTPVTNPKIPIGRPIANTTAYILRDKQLVGICIPGELYIGGLGVARGYLNNEALTREKFINNPFGAGKLYKTGDLARWLPDGTLEYLGRLDDG